MTQAGPSLTVQFGSAQLPPRQASPCSVSRREKSLPDPLLAHSSSPPTGFVKCSTFPKKQILISINSVRNRSALRRGAATGSDFNCLAAEY